MSVVQANKNMSPEMESFKDNLDAEFTVEAGKEAAEEMVFHLTTPTTVTTVTTTTVFL
ncbi:hypothetical protein [Haladaptatus cibarius]|uniref:hypothetical protein n=1 Tax=Haladaptatus cibarius TaxID=453847 RepID=UPI00130DE74D|nr:hypothetical protein [Haladaptatus cibarius]